MKHSWEAMLKRFEADAAVVLGKRGLPITAAALMRQNPKASDRLELMAMLVLYGAHYLHQELKRGRCEHAVGQAFSVCAAYSEMCLFRDVPELAGSWTTIPFPRRNPTLNLAEIIARYQRQGLQSALARAKPNKKTSPDRIEQWQQSANECRSTNPGASMNSIATYVARKHEDRKRIRTITRYLKLHAKLPK